MFIAAIFCRWLWINVGFTVPYLARYVVSGEFRITIVWQLTSSAVDDCDKCRKSWNKL